MKRTGYILIPNVWLDRGEEVVFCNLCFTIVFSYYFVDGEAAVTRDVSSPPLTTGAQTLSSLPQSMVNPLLRD